MQKPETTQETRQRVPKAAEDGGRLSSEESNGARRRVPDSPLLKRRRIRHIFENLFMQL